MLNFSGRVAVAAATSFAFSLGALASPASAHSRTTVASNITYARLAEPRVFARGNATLFNPDGIVVTKKFVFVDYQGQSDHLPGPSTIVKYDLAGHIVGSVALAGRCDGLRLNPVTHLLWATFNNDGLNGRPKRQPLLYTIDPTTLATKLYRFPLVSPHGGGYDDIAFIGGRGYLAASSPTITPDGINDKPAVVVADLTSDGKVKITPLIYGNTLGYDPTDGSTVRFNITDPDSLAVDSHNNLILVGDNDQEIIVIQPYGNSAQKFTRFKMGTQLDDIAWTSGTSGTLWVADTTLQVIYTVAATFPAGTIFGEAPLGTPVQSFLGTFAPVKGLGLLTPLLTTRNGIVNPTSLEFVPAGGATNDI